MTALLPFLILGGLKQERPMAEFRTRTGVIRVYDYATMASDPTTGETTVTGAAGPMTMVDTGNGLTLRGLRMSLVIQTLADNTRLLRRANLGSQAQATLDSELAFNTALAITPGTPKPDVFTKTVVDSDVMTYVAGETAGVLTLMSASQIVTDSKGYAVATKGTQIIRTPFTQHVVVVGKSAQIDLVSNGRTPNPSIKTAHLSGPVEFTLDRTESPVGGQVSLTKVKGIGDNLDADLGAEAPSITLSGNVKVDGSGPGLGGRVEGSKAVVFLDADLKPSRYEFVGKPATTTVQMAEPKKGGGR